MEISSHMTLNTNEVSRQNNSNSTEKEFISVSKGIKQVKIREILKDFETYNKFTELDIEPTNQPTFYDNKDNEDQRFENPCLSKPNQKKKKLQKNEGPVSKLNTFFYSKEMKRENSKQKDRLIVERIRCHKCFETHFPLPKFCRRTKSSFVNTQTPQDSKSKTKFDESLPLILGEYINFL